jgi:hypothetical protein
MLIMRYYDGECSEIEALHAEKLLREHPELEAHQESLASLGALLEDWGHTVESKTEWVPNVDAILDQVKKNESPLNLPHNAGSALRASKSNNIRLKPSIWSRVESGSLFYGLGWASSGAMVAASLVLLFGVNSQQENSQDVAARTVIATTDGSVMDKSTISGAVIPSMQANLELASSNILNDGVLQEESLRTGGDTDTFEASLVNGRDLPQNDKLNVSVLKIEEVKKR